jgi:hypothetical protein
MAPFKNRLLIGVALAAPPLFMLPASEVCYALKLTPGWEPFVFCYVLPQIGALVVLFKRLQWPLWVKGLLVLPYLALTFAFTFYGTYLIGIANGESGML